MLEAATSAKRETTALDSLRARYDSVFAASRQYEQALSEIQTLEDAGALSSLRAAQARETAATSILGAATAQDRFNQSARGFQTSNLAAQVQDVFVSWQMGLPVMSTAIAQGLQASTVFTSLGSRAAIISALGGAFSSLLNPVTLVTVGVIALGGAIVSWMSGSEEKTMSFADALSATNTAISNLSSATDTLAGARLGTLATGYGRVNEALRVHLERLKEVATYEAMTANRDTANAIQDSITGGWITSDIDDVRIALDTTNDSARFFLHLLDEVKQAQTFGEQAKAISTARAYLEGLGINLTTSEGAAKGVLAQLVKSEDAALRLEAASGGSANAIATATGQTTAWGAAMSGVAAELSAITAGLNDISGGGLALAGKAAESAALRAGRTVSQAAQERARVENEAKLRRQTESAGTGIGGYIMGGITAVERYQFDQNARLDSQLEAQRAAAREAATSTTGKGGGGRVEALGDESRQLSQLSKQMNDRIFSIQRENSALALLVEGTVSTKEAAELMSMAMASNNGQLDAGTESTIRLYEAQVQLQAQLEKDAANPLQDYLDSLPTALQSTKQIAADMAGILESTLQDAFTGGFDARKMLDSVRASIASALAKQTTGLILGKLGIGIDKASSALSARMMQTAILTASAQGAQMYAAAIAGSAIPSAGGSGGKGFLGFLGAIFGFSEGGYSDRPGMTTHMVSPVAFRNAPQYKNGTPNTSGIPAILHPNEAVVPLSKGRKIPVDASGLETGGGVGTVTTTHNWGGISVSVQSSGDLSNPAEASKTAEHLAELVTVKIREQLAAESSYGGMLNPRGGR